jgi:hypothetical protein
MAKKVKEPKNISAFVYYLVDGERYQAGANCTIEEFRAQLQARGYAALTIKEEGGDD